MTWSEKFYLDPALKKKYRRIRWKIEHGKAQRTVFLLYVERGHLELIPSPVLLQDGYPRDFCAVGLAGTKAAGFRLIENITSEMYDELGAVDYNRFFGLTDSAPAGGS